MKEVRGGKDMRDPRRRGRIILGGALARVFVLFVDRDDIREGLFICLNHLRGAPGFTRGHKG